MTSSASRRLERYCRQVGLQTSQFFWLPDGAGIDVDWLDGVPPVEQVGDEDGAIEAAAG